MQDYSVDKPVNNRRMGSKSVGYFAFLSLLFLVLAFVWCRPLHRYLFTGIPYEVEPHPGIEVVQVSPQDCLQLYYKYWLFSEFMQGKIPLFSSPYEFATPGARGFTGQQFPISIVFAALRPISPIFAYNFIVLLSFVGCGVFMAMLTLRSVKDRWAALLAGLILCIMPFRAPQLMAGHPNGVAVMFLPLTLFFVDRGLKGSLGAAVGAGLTFSSIALMDMQLCYFSAMLIAAFGMWRTSWICIETWPQTTWNGLYKRLRAPLLIMVTGTLPGIAYLLYVKLVMLRESAIHAEGIKGIRLGPVLQDLWDITIFGERRIYIGFYVLAFAMIGCILPFLLRRTRVGRLRADSLFWLAMVAGGLGLSLSLNPPFNAIVDRIPIARLSRTPARAIVITFVGLAMLSAQGLALSREYLRRYRFGDYAGWVLALLCMGLVLYDYRLQGPRGINVISSASPVYEHIVAADPDARILAVPIWPGDSAMSSSLFHHIIRSRAHLINGYSPVATADYKKNVFDPLSLVNTGQFGPQEWAMARALGVTHLTFHPESFAAPRYVSVFPFQFTLERLKQSPALQWLEHADPVDGFRMKEVVDWESAPKKWVVSPVGFSVAGWNATSCDGRTESSVDALSGALRTGIGGETNAAFLWAGRVLPPGDYVMGLRLGVQSADGISPDTPVSWSAAVEESTGGSVQTLAVESFETNANDGIQWYRIPFSVKNAQRVGFKLVSGEPATFALDLCMVSFAGTSEAREWEAEALFHAGRSVMLTDASGGKAVQLGQNDPTQGVVRGPFQYVPSGAYECVVQLRGKRMDEKQNKKIVRLQISNHLTPDSIYEIVFAAQEWGCDALPQDGKWHEVLLPFDVPQSGAILELRVDRLQGAEMEVDRVAIRARTATKPR